MNRIFFSFNDLVLQRRLNYGSEFSALFSGSSFSLNFHDFLPEEKQPLPSTVQVFITSEIHPQDVVIICSIR